MTLVAPRYRKAHPRAQIQHLCRIGKRALAHADWIEELLATSSPRILLQEGERWRADVVASRAKAFAACEEMLAIAEANSIRPGPLQVVQ